MKRILRLVILIGAGTAIALIAPFKAQAQESRFYLSGDLGGAFTEADVKFDPGVRAGFAGGYQITDWVAAEAQLGATINSVARGLDFFIVTRTGNGGYLLFHDITFANVPLLFNVKLQYPNRSPWAPYIGGGLGVSAAILDADTERGPDVSRIIRAHATEAEAVFAYQAFAGLSCRLNDRLKISVEYRYLAAESPQWTIDTDGGALLTFGPIKTHTISLALDYRF